MSAITGLIIAVLAISWASILIRWCGDTSPVVISFYRMFWSALIFLIYQGIRNPSKLNFRKLPGKNIGIMVLAGAFLAAHFVTWISGVQLTKISHAVLLGSTHPVFALMMSPFFLREKGSWRTVLAALHDFKNITLQEFRGSWRTVLAALLTLTGIGLIAGQDWGFGSTEMTGDFLAVFSALFVTFYIFIARHQRREVDLIPYLIAVYASAAFFLLLTIFAQGLSLWHYSWQVHLMMFLLAVIPTGIGHSLINWAARRIEAYKVNFSILGEPLFASLLAYFLFGEKPYGLFYIGAVFVVMGIVFSFTERKEAA